MIRLALPACLPLLVGCSEPIAFGISTTLDQAVAGEGGQSWIAVGSALTAAAADHDEGNGGGEDDG